MASDENGSQVGFRDKDASNAETNKQVVIESENLAYDFIHYEAQYGQGISGVLELVTFGARDTAQAAGSTPLTGVTVDLIISGWDHTADKGQETSRPTPSITCTARFVRLGQTLPISVRSTLSSIVMLSISSDQGMPMPWSQP